MIFISNFYKLITIIILIILIFTIFTNFNKEKFNEDETVKEDKINFIINKIPKHDQSSEDKGKNQFKIRWWHDKNQQIIKYVLVTFINNKGPYLDIFTIDTDEKSYTYNDGEQLSFNGDDDNEIHHIHDNIKGNVKYKYSIYAVYDPNSGKNISGKNIKEVTLSNVDDTIDVVKSSSFKSAILCKPDGAHKIISSDKCDSSSNKKKNRAIIATNSLELRDEEPNYFNEENYKDLINDLNSNKILKYNLEFNLTTNSVADP